MQVLEVYFDGSAEYYLLSRNVIDLINAVCKSSDTLDIRLDESTECNWAVSAAQLRAVLSQSTTVTDATNLMQLIVDMGHSTVRLCGISWQSLTAWPGQWYDLKPMTRTILEGFGISDGTFIFQGV